MILLSLIIWSIWYGPYHMDHWFGTISLWNGSSYGNNIVYIIWLIIIWVMKHNLCIGVYGLSYLTLEVYHVFRLIPDGPSLSKIWIQRNWSCVLFNLDDLIESELPDLKYWSSKIKVNILNHGGSQWINHDITTVSIKRMVVWSYLSPNRQIYNCDLTLKRETFSMWANCVWKFRPMFSCVFRFLVSWHLIGWKYTCHLRCCLYARVIKWICQYCDESTSNKLKADKGKIILHKPPLSNIK